ncbi:MAG TPA: hypothetical protein VJ385_07650 [Fibrobacteria bacterium]|nr:hypothetical protein [Fibrobacteria bacterium]
MDGKRATSITVGRSAVSAHLAAAEIRGGPGGGSASGRKPKSRRSFSPVYKLRVLMRAREALESGRGGLSRFLKEEGLYSSHLAQWRRQCRQGLLGKAHRGRPQKNRDGLLRENGRLKRRLSYLEECLRKDLQRRDPAAMAVVLRLGAGGKEASRRPGTPPANPPASRG